MHGHAEAARGYVGEVEDEVGRDGDAQEGERAEEQEDRLDVGAAGGLGDGCADGREEAVLLVSLRF